MRRLAGLIVLVLSFGALALPNSLAQWGACTNCGGWPWNDSCGMTTAGTIQTGNYYELLVEDGPYCNGPKECKEIKAEIKVETSERRKYYLEGSIGYEAFGLKAGYENDKSTVAGCNPSQTCKTPGCCVGPLYGYLVYTYDQRVQNRYNFSKKWYCNPCTTESKFGTLKTVSHVACGPTKFNGYVPPLMTPAAYCTGVGGSVP